jgi:two-component sensor histidine kinase
LRLRWQESGGPPVTPPDRRGFGSHLIEGGLAKELNGEVRLDYEPAGVVCQIVMSFPPRDGEQQ